MFHVFTAPMAIPSIGVCCSILRQESGREPGGRAAVSFRPRSEACSSELSTSPQRRNGAANAAGLPTGRLEERPPGRRRLPGCRGPAWQGFRCRAAASRLPSAAKRPTVGGERVGGPPSLTGLRCSRWWSSEGRLLAGDADRRRPGIGGAAPRRPLATVAGTDPAGTMPGPGGLGDRRRRVTERRADLIDLHLDDGALLALLGLEGALLEAALCHHPGAAGQRLGDVLRRLPPHAAAQEERLSVLPLLGLAVQGARGGGDGEGGDRCARGCPAQLGVAGQ